MNDRLPWAPLEQRLTLLFGCRRHLHGCTCPNELRVADQDWCWVRQPCWTIDDAARRLGVHGRTVARWIREGLDLRQADRAACAAGLTPDRLWAEWEAISLEHADRVEEMRALAYRRRLDANAARKAARRLAAA